MTNVPTPDRLHEVGGLTPRQREVLALVAKGLTNPEIADRLGISRDGVKWHVGEILGRIGVDTREEAGDLWRRYNGLPYRLHRLAGAALGTTALRWLIGGMGATAVAGLAVVLLVLALHGGNSPDRDSATSTTVTTQAPTVATQTSTVPGTATANSGLLPGARMIASAPDSSFPPNTNLLIVDGPWGKDGGPLDLRRVYRIGNGPAQQTMLYKPADGVFMLSVLSDTSSQNIYLSTCAGTDCPSLGESPGIVTTFLRSTDGGVTWTKVGEQPGKWGVTAFYDGDAIAGRAFGKQPEYVDVVTGKAVDVPASLANLSMVNAGGQPGWWNRNNPAVLGLSGSSILKPGGFDVTGYEGIGLLLGGPGGVGVVTMMQTYDAAQAAGSTKQHQYLMQYPRDVDGEPTILAFPDGAPYPGGWIDSNNLVVGTLGQKIGTCPGGNTAIGLDPAILDINSATLSVIQDPFFDPCTHGSQRVAAVQTGPLAQVKTDGDCLNLRTQPSTAAESARCLADGVLVTVTGPLQSGGSQPWLPVTAPDGTTGYVAAEFLITAQA